MENYEDALRYYSQAKDIKSEYGLKTSTIFILNDMFTAERRLGNYRSARLKVEECIVYLRDRGNPYHLAGSLWQLGDVLISLEEFEQSTIHLRESLELLQHLPPSRFKGFCLFSLIKSLHLQGKVQDAARLLGAIEVETGRDYWQLTAYRNADYNRTHATIKTVLGESTFTNVYAEGKTMTLDQGVVYALEVVGK